MVIAVDVQDPGNVGAIVRVAEAGGATAVVVAGASADPFGWKALRGSMGSALRLPILRRPGQPPWPSRAARGCRILATAPRGGRSFRRGPPGPDGGRDRRRGTGPPASRILAEADERVTIPMQAPVESLNTAVTAAAF